ncbi:unnamed protein product [Owenia fusiformis]|uniref:Fibronectin type-III domain-containing protein n=1 Tax=Owenia fusiformis TaxID=6347 RepID=A0A8S4N118_OWEFU|nr:unnamed protein product [Owenia fusiformis]
METCHRRSAQYAGQGTRLFGGGTCILTMTISWIMLFGLCLVIPAKPVRGFFIATPGEMSPVNPRVELRNYIELNCTLTGDVAPFNSSHLYFQAGSKVISSKFYKILSPTIMTYKENMTGQYAGRYPFYCYLNQTMSGEKMKPRLIGSQVATIGRKPEKSRNLTARFNYWNSGDIYWEPVQKNTTLVHTSTNVAYSWIYGSRIFNCQVSSNVASDVSRDVTSASCTCTKNHCHFSRIIASQRYLYLFIENSNIFGTEKSFHKIDVDNNVVPSPVKSVLPIVNGSDAVNVTWVPSVEDDPVQLLHSVYRVLYRRIYSAEPWQNAGETVGEWLLVKGLQPYQGYTFNVSVRVNYRNSSDRNAWSESKQGVAITDKDSSGCPPCLPCVNGCRHSPNDHDIGSGVSEGSSDKGLEKGCCTDWKDMSIGDRNNIMDQCKQGAVSELTAENATMTEVNLEKYTACVLGRIKNILP